MQTFLEPKEKIFNLVNEMNGLQLSEIVNYAQFILYKNDNNNFDLTKTNENTLGFWNNKEDKVWNKNSVSAFGSLSKYANANLIDKEKDAWEIYAREKYTSH